MKWTLIYQSESKVFITEWQDGIELNENMTSWDILYIFGFDYVEIIGGSSPVFDDPDVTWAFMYELSDNSRLFVGFWVNERSMTWELRRVYHQISREESIRVF